MPKVLNAQTTDTRSALVKIAPTRSDQLNAVGIYVSGLAGRTVSVDALAPDGSAWLPLISDSNPIGQDGFISFLAGPCVLSLKPSAAGGALNAWIEPDSSAFRDQIRTLEDNS